MRASSKQVEFANTTSPSDQSKSRNEPCVNEMKMHTLDLKKSKYEEKTDWQKQNRSFPYLVHRGVLALPHRELPLELRVVALQYLHGLNMKAVQDLDAHAFGEIVRKASGEHSLWMG